MNEWHNPPEYFVVVVGNRDGDVVVSGVTSFSWRHWFCFLRLFLEERENAPLTSCFLLWEKQFIEVSAIQYEKDLRQKKVSILFSSILPILITKYCDILGCISHYQILQPQTKNYFWKLTLIVTPWRLAIHKLVPSFCQQGMWRHTFPSRKGCTRACGWAVSCSQTPLRRRQRRSDHAGCWHGNYIQTWLKTLKEKWVFYWNWNKTRNIVESVYSASIKRVQKFIMIVGWINPD